MLPALALSHGWMLMAAGGAAGANLLGLYLATAAFPLLLFQVAIGVSLRRSDVGGRNVIRLLHFANMLAIAVLVACHLALSRW